MVYAVEFVYQRNNTGESGFRFFEEVRIVSSKGGMQTLGLTYTIYCEKCGKPAAKKDEYPTETRYLHFTKKGSVWHIVKKSEQIRGGSDCEKCETKQKAHRSESSA